VTETQQTPNRPLFRPEAVEAHARGRGVDDEGLELKEERTTWAFRLLLLALAVAIAAGLTVRIDETARGRATVAGNTAVVDLPIGAFPRLKPGQQVRLHSARGEIAFVGAPQAGAGGVTTVPVTVNFTKGEVVPGEAEVTLSRRTLAELLLGRDGG
jgi:hypothetical protein